MRAGTFAHGQGHQTAFAMLVNDQTGIPIDRIRLVDGDTDLVPTRRRHRRLAVAAARRLGRAPGDRGCSSSKAKRLAAHLLEADVADIVVDTDAGTVGVAGVPAGALTWAELARARRRGAAGRARRRRRCRASSPPRATSTRATRRSRSAPTSPSSRSTSRPARCASCATSPSTTAARCSTRCSSRASSTAASPPGIGQALYEEVRHDADGNPLTANLADYGIPTAAELPSFEVRSTETPTPLNPLGAKGIGEAATIGSTPAVQNAVIDALAHLGVRHLDMPCTPERVWRAIRDAEAGTLPDPWREPPAVFATLRAGQAVDEEGLDAAEGI